MFGALEIDHHFELVLHDVADDAACGARSAFVLKEGFADVIEHDLDGLVQHAITQAVDSCRF